VGPSRHDQKSDLGFLIDPDKGEVWTKAFKARLQVSLFQNPPIEVEVEKEAEAFTADIHKTNEKIFCKQHPPHPKASLWWNAVCAIAAQNLWDAEIPEAQDATQGKLKGTVRAAK
jgi:hypothetical protein